jgi:hypothetical protein
MAKTKRQDRELAESKVLRDLLYCMEDLGISKAELSRRLCCDYHSVHRMLTGISKMSIGRLSDYCHAIGVEVDIKIIIPAEAEIRIYK